ncbi:HAMP domain-containing histidine kinase [Micrococcales bacterium 31B]|nr:HAMP domain-containing histidine kinase [Micrococcales bacterium 31B]
MSAPRATLRTRLWLAQAAIVAVGSLVAALVAALVGPPLFHDHLLQAGLTLDATGLHHVERAYADAGVVALAAGFVIALAAGFGVSWYFARRLTRPLHELDLVAGRLAQGDYSARMASTALSSELQRVTDAVNGMAERLGATEATRRRLLTDLAHEMRTPLATLSAYLDGLDEGLIGWDAQSARVLREHTVRLVRLSDDMGEASRAEEDRLDLDLRPVDARALADEACAAMRAAYVAKGVRLSVDGASVTLRADAQRLGQVLGNLLSNALRHTPAGGRVSVRVRDLGSRAEIEVRDTGEGIAAEHLPHVFERFYRGDSARDRDHGGSGIGLTIARGIVRSSGGDLTVRSDGLECGATLILSLPVDS